jgi:AAA15 family ATPase/GTPase
MYEMMITRFKLDMNSYFEVARMGRVNLIVGKNNSGKSSVLEALRIYAGNAQRALLESIANEHDERFRYAASGLRVELFRLRKG